MPALANITVKKNDGTTDVTFTAVAPSAGDKSPAIWRNNALGTAAAFHPEFRLQAQSNGPKTARRVECTFVYPSTAVGTDGKINIVDKGIFTASAVVPQGMLDSDVAEYVAQGCNLMASLLVKESIKTGFAPT